MMENDNCYPIMFAFDKKVYCRISAQIYNEMSDYEFMAEKFKNHLNSKKFDKKEKNIESQ